MIPRCNYDSMQAKHPPKNLGFSRFHQDQQEQKTQTSESNGIASSLQHLHNTISFHVQFLDRVEIFSRSFCFINNTLLQADEAKWVIHPQRVQNSFPADVMEYCFTGCRPCDLKYTFKNKDVKELFTIVQNTNQI